MSWKDKVLKWWFVISAAALAFLYFMLDRRNRTLQQLAADAQRQLIAQKLTNLRDKAEQSEAHHLEAMDEYYALKQRHGDLLNQLGVVPGAAPKPNPKPNGGGHQSP